MVTTTRILDTNVLDTFKTCINDRKQKYCSGSTVKIHFGQCVVCSGTRKVRENRWLSGNQVRKNRWERGRNWAVREDNMWQRLDSEGDV